VNGRPEVGSKVGTADSAIRGRFDSHCYFRKTKHLPGNQTVDLGIAAPVQPPLEFSDGARELGANVFHDSHGMPTRGIVNPFRSDSPDGNNAQSEDMTKPDRWPQRETFRAALEGYLSEHDKTQAEVCDLLGIKLTYLRNTLYRSDKRLSVDILSKAAAIFGCSVTEFIDDPGSAPGGIDLSAISPNDRFRCERAFKILTVEDLTDSQHQMLLAELEATLARIRAMKAELS